MNIAEFKAWFDGFCAGFGDAPTPEQWAAVNEKVETLAMPHHGNSPMPVGLGQWRGAQARVIGENWYSDLDVTRVL